MKIINKILVIIAFGLAMFSYLFQVPFSSLSSLMIPAIAAYIILFIRYFRPSSKWMAVYLLYLILLIISLLISINIEVEFTRSSRFLIILMLLPICSCFNKRNFKTEWSIFRFLVSLKAIMVIAIWLYVLLTKNWLPLRHWAETNEFGDVYMTSWLPRVQLQGNAIFALAFIVSLFTSKKLNWFTALMLFASVAAGNVAFIMGIAIAIAIYCWLKIRKNMHSKGFVSLLYLSILTIGFCVAMYFFIDQMQEKSTGANAVRVEQAQMLLKTNFLFGNGLGYEIVENTTTRSYNGQLYFELQSLYIYNQIGIIAFILFYYLTFEPFVKSKLKIALYAIYLLYSFWNPYCFDFNHLIALLLINNVCDQMNFNICIERSKLNYDKQNNSNSISIFSTKTTRRKCRENVSASR